MIASSRVSYPLSISFCHTVLLSNWAFSVICTVFAIEALESPREFVADPVPPPEFWLATEALVDELELKETLGIMLDDVLVRCETILGLAGALSPYMASRSNAPEE